MIELSDQRSRALSLHLIREALTLSSCFDVCDEVECSVLFPCLGVRCKPRESTFKFISEMVH